MSDMKKNRKYWWLAWEHDDREGVANTDVSVRFRATVEYDEDIDVYVARSPELNILSQGTTKQEAREALADAIHSYVVVKEKLRRKT